MLFFKLVNERHQLGLRDSNINQDGTAVDAGVSRLPWCHKFHNKGKSQTPDPQILYRLEIIVGKQHLWTLI